MSYLEKVIYLTLNQYNTLASDGTVTYNGTTLTGINDDYLYITSDPITVNDITGVLPINKGGTGLTSIAQDSLLIGSANNDFTTIAKTTVINSSSTNSLLPTALSVYTYALMKTGGTLSGKLTLQSGVYNDAANTGALDLRNSNIYGVNSIYTADASDNAGEGINFYRDATHNDTLWINGGAIYFVPNRAYGSSTTAGASLKVVRMPATVTSGAALIADGTAGLVSFKGITDNATATAVTTSDTNLITARTLANAGYVKSSGVTKVSTGAGLTGGDITTTGTVKANLVSETKLGSASSAATEVSGRVYPVALDKDGKLAVNVPWTNVNNNYLTGITTTVTGSGNAITAVEVSGSTITFTKGATYNNYSHPTTTGNKHIPSGGSSGLFLGWSADGTAAWVANPNTNTTYSLSGALSSHKFSSTLTPSSGSATTADITFAAGTNISLTDDTSNRKITIANTYSLPTATYNTLGGVKPAYSSSKAVTLTTTAATNTDTPTIAAKSTTSNRYYAVETDKDGILFVNVPWTNVNNSYLTGVTTTVSGSGNGVTGVTASGDTITVTKGNFLTSHLTYTSFTGKPTGNQTPGFGSTFTIQQISLSTTGQVSGTDRTVTIPSTLAKNDTVGLVKPWYNHTSASTGPTAGSNATAVAVNTITTTSGRYYAIEADSNGRLFVNVPWTNVNSSYLTGITSTSSGSGNAVTSVSASGSTITYTLGSVAPATGSTSITTLGTITTGTWNGTAISSSYIGSHNHSGNNITSGTVSGTYLGVMTGATSSTAGTKGAVPAPAAGDQNNFLCGDGTWGSYSPTVLTLTLTASSWTSEKTLAVPANGVTTTNTVIVGPAPSSITDYTNANIVCTTQGVDVLVFSTTRTPTTDITINVVIFDTDDNLTVSQNALTGALTIS